MKINPKQLLVAVVITLLIAFVATSCGNTRPKELPKGHLVTETYIVQSGDGLDKISYKFMAKSSVPRELEEFREGIIQLNWETVFKDRYPHGLIKGGDRLQINYWVGGELNDK